MKPHSRSILAVTALCAADALQARSMAQSADFQFAPDYFIVRVVESVAPIVLADGQVSFIHEQGADQIPEGVVAELLIADLLEEWGATAIEPYLRVELQGEVLAAATEAGMTRQYLVQVPIGTDIALVTEILSLFVTHVDYASPLWYAELLQTTDPLVGEQWSLHNTGQPLNFPCPDLLVGCGPCGNGEGLMGTPDADIDAPEAWTLETGVPDVVVMTLDTGADLDHPDLDEKLVSGRNYAKGECEDACDLPRPEHPCPDDPCDPYDMSHGTFVAGVIGAATNNGQGIAGVTHGCTVMPVRIGDDDVGIPISAIENGMWYARQPEVDVDIINMSFHTKPGVLESSINEVFDAGILMVAGAGNCLQIPPGGCTEPVEYPASDARVMAVTSVNFKDERSCFANLGPELSVAAPGEDIISTSSPTYGWDCNPQTDPDPYCRGNGTSYAAPHVSGVAALVWSANPHLTHLEVRRIIQATADDLGEPGHDSHYGCGRVNAFRAVNRALCPDDIDEDCVIGVQDFLMLLAEWGDCQDQCCPADVNGDGDVGVVEFLGILGAWGSCHPECPVPLSLAEEIQAAGLTQEEWNTLQDCVVNGAEPEAANCACWLEHYFSCHRDPECVEPGPVLCSGEDPLGHH